MSSKAESSRPSSSVSPGEPCTNEPTDGNQADRLLPPPSGVMGRLDSLVDLVFERYKDRYFPNEQCFIDIQGDK